MIIPKPSVDVSSFHPLGFLYFGRICDKMWMRQFTVLRRYHD